MFTSALRAHSAKLNNRIGLIRDSRLTPLARTAVSSPSALKRPKTSSVAVNMPIGSANTHAKGINKAAASATTPKVSWRFTSSGRISWSALPSNSTNVNTITVIISAARIWRIKYACNVFNPCPSSAASPQCATQNAARAANHLLEIVGKPAQPSVLLLLRVCQIEVEQQDDPGFDDGSLSAAACATQCFSTSFIPHLGQSPGLSCSTSGCMG